MSFYNILKNILDIVDTKRDLFEVKNYDRLMAKHGSD